MTEFGKKLPWRITGQVTKLKMALSVEYGSALLPELRHWSVKTEVLSIGGVYVGGFRKLGTAFVVHEPLSSSGPSSIFPSLSHEAISSLLLGFERGNKLSSSICATTLYCRHTITVRSQHSSRVQSQTKPGRRFTIPSPSHAHELKSKVSSHKESRVPFFSLPLTY